MNGLTGKRLVFRLSGVGFSLAIEDLLEIVAAESGTIDASAADAGLGLFGLLEFRDEAVHVRDLCALFSLAPVASPAVFLVVVGSDGAWALPAERVEGIFPAGEFRSCPLPPLLATGPALPFAAVDRWRDEPLVRFTPVLFEQWLGAA